MRTVLRTLLAGFLVGALGLGSAWAGAVLTQPAGERRAGAGGAVGELGDALGMAAELAGGERGAAPAGRLDAERVDAGRADAGRVGGSGTGEETAAVAGGERLSDGWFRAGTAVRSLVPPADRWKQADECRGQAPEQLYTPLVPDGCLITFDMLWADGVDEANPIEVRAAALGNGEDLVVIAVMDLVGYMAAYPLTSCRDCGIAQIAETLSGELGVPADRFVISSTHTHAAPTTIADGPTWYYEHVRDQVLDAIRAAVAEAAANPPVRVETGATLAKAFNTDRRIVDRAVPDYELGWLRAFVPAAGGNPAGAGEETIFTLGNFAVHPTIRAGNAELHSGFVGPFARRINERLGGEGVFFPGGLGDQRVDRGYGVNGHGIGLADLIADDVERGGHVLASNDIAVARTDVKIPVENQFFAGALATGYAVRDILPPFGGGPLTVSVTKGGANAPVCTSAAALHVVGPVSVIRLGERPPPGKQDLGPEYRLPVEADNVVLVQGPGEMFASMGLIVKDALSRSSNVLFTSMANDTLGYMMPANQYDLFASQGLGLVGNVTKTWNYEEALSLGRCSGEIVMKAMLELGAELGVMGEGEGP
jgi:hypothetical protein